MSGEHRLDDVIQHPTRLTVMAFLSGTLEAEFGAVRDYAEISDASVSRIVSALQEAGYVNVRKGYVGKRPRTWLSLTPEGRGALAGHLEALRAIAETARQAASGPG
ncbi:transcriptional regulator [Nonomuraea spiralis]|uniref:winged helix-turn-helix domain-containing protein n=1 Tax=Nonomuraea TaxID=83681 RepID=UPI000F791DA8|nr:transcriptional regulator [Nonomuraea sp. WAC 01424]RSM94636.1 MarR family transcriptional regulator [Nonomuraea sp. WAC 01424]